MMAVFPPVGVLLMAYGTPETLDDVEAYYTHIRGGRPPTPAALEDLRERYRRVGGRTPLLALSRGVATQLQARFDAEVPGRYRVYVAMRHWHPYIADVVPQMLADGIREVVALVLAPHYSRYSLEGYRAAINQVLSGVSAPFALRFVEGWHEERLFRQLMADRVREVLATFAPQARVAVVFSAHSLPQKVVAAGDPYPQQLRDSAAGIAALAGLESYVLCYQSAAPTGEPWLGPDILDVVDALHVEGVGAMVSVPFGFVADHLEVLWDIDIEARERAAQWGMVFRRIRMPNDDSAFVDVIRAVVVSAYEWR